MNNNALGTALITGGAKRIGAAIARKLAEAGYDIALHYNHSRTEAEVLQTLLKREFPNRVCELFQADLSVHSEVITLASAVTSRFDNWNLLINNASIFERATIAETTEEDFNRHLDINLKAPFFLTQQFAKACNNGQIINLLDVYQHTDNSAFSAYLLSKKSLFDLTKMAAKEYAPRLRVNGIALGLTEMKSDQVSPDFIENKIRTLPLGRAVSLEEITQTLLQLIANQALTGQCIYLDSGQHLL